MGNINKSYAKISIEEYNRLKDDSMALSLIDLKKEVVFFRFRFGGCNVYNYSESKLLFLKHIETVERMLSESEEENRKLKNGNVLNKILKIWI